jgi:hypothetical protein
MGAIAPSKIPKSTVKRDGNEPVGLYAEGGKVWNTPNPAKKHKTLSPGKKAAAKAAAKAAGRPYPNLIDNMRMAKGK